MFKMFSTMTLFGLLAVSAAFGESNQTLKAHIPFAFLVRNTTLTAGNYELTYDAGLHALFVHGLDQNSRAEIALPSRKTVPLGGPSKLVFHCYDKSCWWCKCGRARETHVWNCRRRSVSAGLPSLHACCP